MTEPPQFRPQFRIETLQIQHQRESFEWGVAALDLYLRAQASEDVKKHAAVAFVLTPDGVTIAGYYTLSQYSVELVAFPEEIIRRLPKYRSFQRHCWAASRSAFLSAESGLGACSCGLGACS